MKKRSPITTHILDLTKGKAASGVWVQLEFKDKTKWQSLSKNKTNQDGRVETLLPVDYRLKKGTYRLSFNLQKYDKKSFYPEAVIEFSVKDPLSHYHIPLLYSLNGYSTYRGT